ncbi:hypothetical protein AWC14_19635 [Mycobacterium kyorinense]|uniref:Uncharacterized protein n=1 Tax=Mycobacterium kyorinense TaxID=487514 RepID=A0A1X1YJC6_9MYCO|nr:hypothetical protein I552_0460 [Mycobacterium xenopi 3993]KMV21744.1 hypothetical protein ACT16_14760 [Mycobacterium heckeshornense]ORW11123.1 hypothetical protein AWC14_19635 [Mycobacterium kyorinense]
MMPDQLTVADLVAAMARHSGLCFRLRPAPGRAATAAPSVQDAAGSVVLNAPLPETISPEVTADEYLETIREQWVRPAALIRRSA